MTEPLPTIALPPAPDPLPAVPPTPLAPLPGEARDPVLDALRGAALLGVLAVNIFAFGHPPGTGPGASATSAPGGWALGLTSLLFTGKAYALLALLFGHGVGALALRVTATGADPRPVLKRRLLALGAIGLVHGLLGWFGDILLTYAAFGLLLLLFLKATPRALLWWAGGLLAFGASCFLVLGGALQLATGMASQAGLIETMNSGIRAETAVDGFAALRAYGEGPYAALAQRRVGDALAAWGSAVAVSPQVLALFLVGLWSARVGLATDPARRPALARAAVALAAVGLPVNLLYAHLAGGGLEAGVGISILALAAYGVAAPALAGAAAATLLLLRHAGPVQPLLKLLSPLGRVSLSAYLLQTVVLTNLFYFHGAGLYGRLSFPALLALAPTLWLVELALAHLWLGRFRLGPAEWLLRRLTYGVPRGCASD